MEAIDLDCASLALPDPGIQDVMFLPAKGRLGRQRTDIFSRKTLLMAAGMVWDTDETQAYPTRRGLQTPAVEKIGRGAEGFRRKF